MFAIPDAVKLIELAASLNLDLTDAEAELFLPVILESMRELDKFVQSRADESAPAATFPRTRPWLQAIARRGSLPGLALEMRHRRQRWQAIAGWKNRQLARIT